MAVTGLATLLAPQLCWGCGGRATRGQPLCRGCRGSLRWLRREPVVLAGVLTWAPVAYEGPARALVRGLKYRAAAGLAEPLAAQMAAGAPSGWLEDATLVPVPLHGSRQRRRGFNQAERLATALARRSGLATHDCLAREGRARPHAGLGRADRLAAPSGGVRMRAKAEAPSSALLVDDVATTGATLATCAAALLAGGCTQVRAIAYARTLAR